MIKISKKAQYGLRAMVHLAKQYKTGKICSAKKISEKEGIPFDFLEKIIRQLSDVGLVKGRKGFQGGYMLSRSPVKVTAKDIVSVLENPPAGGKKPVVNCALCQRKNKCPTKNVWEKVETALYKTLERITLADL